MRMKQPPSSSCSILDVQARDINGTPEATISRTLREPPQFVNKQTGSGCPAVAAFLRQETRTPGTKAPASATLCKTRRG
jgi:hypothetical protein